MPDGNVALIFAEHGDLMEYVGMLFALLMSVLVGGVIFLVIRMRSRERERIATMAIQHNQPEVARHILRGNSRFLLWIVLGILALVIIAKIGDWRGHVIIAVVAIVTFKMWYPLLAGSSRGDRPIDTPRSNASPNAGPDNRSDNIPPPQ